MARHLEAMGWNDHPAWTVAADSEVLTKAGAQMWIRHLLALETPALVTAPVAQTAPERIWLQVNDCVEDAQLPFPLDHGDVTWSVSKAMATTVGYVREDLATRGKAFTDTDRTGCGS